MGGAKAFEGFPDRWLGSQILRMALEDQGEIAIQGLLHHHLGVGGHEHLAAIAISDRAQQGIDLLLAKDFQMGVGLIDQQHTAFVGIEVRQDEEHLLKAAASQGEIERPIRSNLLVEQIEGASFVFLGCGEGHLEEAPHQGGDLLPIMRVVLMHHEAKIAQHLSCAAPAHVEVNPVTGDQGFIG